MEKIRSKSWENLTQYYLLTCRIVVNVIVWEIGRRKQAAGQSRALGRVMWTKCLPPDTVQPMEAALRNSNEIIWKHRKLPLQVPGKVFRESGPSIYTNEDFEHLSKLKCVNFLFSNGLNWSPSFTDKQILSHTHMTDRLTDGMTHRNAMFLLQLYFCEKSTVNRKLLYNTCIVIHFFSHYFSSKLSVCTTVCNINVHKLLIYVLFA